jgi:DNA (cytosine-5)-methyltransferase 1
MSLDNLNPQSNLKAIGAFIFGGSASIGVMEAGFHLDQVLEMTEDMKEQNAYHFTKNFPSIPVMLPSEWENEQYFESLKKENYDVLVSNCPCSSLSQINRNAKLDGANNVQFYRVFNIINKIEPKVFFIENAPTLVKLGYPIIQDMTKELGNKYKFTVIRDCAGHHNVPMRRMRTVVMGWRKDVFENKIPLVHMNKQEPYRTIHAIGDLYNRPVNDETLKNHTLVHDKTWTPVEHLFNYVEPGTSALMSFIKNWEKLQCEVSEDYCIKEVVRAKTKLDNDQRLWDKTPFRVTETNYCPSMTSVTRIIHPIHNRTLTIREYARLMGYPDSFEFFEECKTNIFTAIAQGVPKNFIKYIAEEVKAVYNKERELVEDSIDSQLMFQHHNHKVWKLYSSEEVSVATELDYEKSTKTFKPLEI